MWNQLRSDTYRFLHARATRILLLIYVVMMAGLSIFGGIVSNTTYAMFDLETDTFAHYLLFLPKSMLFVFFVLLGYVLLLGEEYQSGYVKNVYPLMQNPWRLALAKILSFLFIWGLFFLIGAVMGAVGSGVMRSHWGELSWAYALYLAAQLLYALMLAMTISLLIHLFRGKLAAVLFVTLHSMGVICSLLIYLLSQIGAEKLAGNLPYMLSATLPSGWESGAYAGMFGIVGVCLLLAYAGSALVLRTKDL